MGVVLVALVATIAVLAGGWFGAERADSGPGATELVTRRDAVQELAETQREAGAEAEAGIEAPDRGTVPGADPLVR